MTLLADPPGAERTASSRDDQSLTTTAAGRTASSRDELPVPTPGAGRAASSGDDLAFSSTAAGRAASLGEVPVASPGAGRTAASRDELPLARPDAGRAASSRDELPVASPGAGTPSVLCTTIRAAEMGLVVLCLCSGNCGSPVCHNGKRDNGDRHCCKRAMNNSRYCRRCACEALCGAQRSKFKPRMRFCGECDSQRVAKKNECSYVNATGVHRYGPDWGVPLQVAAFLAFLLSLLQPGDIVAYLDLCEACGAAPGHAFTSKMWVTVFLGHAMKWPPVVLRWQSLVAARHPESVEDFISMIRDVRFPSNGSAMA